MSVKLAGRPCKGVGVRSSHTCRAVVHAVLPAWPAISWFHNAPLPSPCLAVGTAMKRAAVFASFVFTKQPARIRQVRAGGLAGWRADGPAGWRALRLPNRAPWSAAVNGSVLGCSKGR